LCFNAIVIVDNVEVEQVCITKWNKLFLYQNIKVPSDFNVLFDMWTQHFPESIFFSIQSRKLVSWV